MKRKILIFIPQPFFYFFEYSCFRYVSFVLMAAIFVLFSSCSMEDKSSRYFVFGSENSNENDEKADSNSEKTDYSLWTILIYMAADNELESAAISDIIEMESVDFPSDVNILVLFDRAVGYDTSNGDWTGTRLYKISKNESTNKNIISSEILECEELELSSKTENELDMGNEKNLSGFLHFARSSFHSENIGLIIWGHGSGWKGFSEDETNSSLLSLKNLRLGIEHGMEYEKLDFIGFDTCFSSTLEVAFELKDCAKFMAGTPGIVSENGWNYYYLFTDFLKSGMLAEDFIQSCQNQFEKIYSSYDYGAFCQLNLSQVENLVLSFNSFSKTATLKIKDFDIRNKIFKLIENESVSYLSTQFPTDFYVDIFSLKKILCSVLDYDDVILAGEIFENALNSAVAGSWNVSGGCSLGVFFGFYKSSGIFSQSHYEPYIKGSRDSDACNFVSLCDGYVPTKNCSGSLLDKLFYTNF